MCYKTILTMLTTYGNWCYADEVPLAKRRKTSKVDSNKIKDENMESINSNNMTDYNKPFLTVRSLIGDQLSAPKYPSGNLIQNGVVYTNVGRGINNPYYIQGYTAMPHPSMMFGVRGVPNVWPGRVQIPNGLPRYGYRQSTIARPYPLRVRPVFNSFPIQLAHTGWIRASVSSAFTPFRHIYPEHQTTVVTTQPVETTQSSSIQSLTQMVCSVTAATSASSTEALSANSVFTHNGIVSSESSQSQTAKPTAQPNATAPPSSTQTQKPPKLQASYIPVETVRYSPSLQTVSKSACSVTTTVTTSSAEDLSVKSTFSTARPVSPVSSTSKTSVVTDQTIMTAQPSHIQSPGSMIDAFTSSATVLLPEDLSVKNASSIRTVSLGSSTSQTPIATNQPIMAAQPSPTQLSSSMINSFTSSTSTLMPEDLSVKSTVSTTQIVSPELSTSQTSVVTNQAIMAAQPSPIQSPSPMTGSFTSTTALLPEDLSVKSTFSTPWIVSPESSTSQTSIVTDSPIMAAQPSPTQSSGSMIDAFTSSTTAFVPEDLSVKSASSTFSMVSPGSSTSQMSVVINQPITAEQPSPNQSPGLVIDAFTSSTPTTLPEDLSLNCVSSTPRIVSPESLQSQDFKFTTATSPVSPNQVQEPPKFKPSHIPVQTIVYSSSLRAPKLSFCSVTTATTTTVTTSSDEGNSGNSVFNRTWIMSSESSISQTSTVISPPIMSTQSSSTQTQEPSKFQLSHIPVKTIMYSPSLRAANQSFQSVTSSTTTTVTTSSAEELCAKSTFNTAPSVPSKSLISQAFESATQSVTAAPSSSIRTQEPPKFRSSHIPVQTIMYSPSLRPKIKTVCPATTTSTVVTILLDEEVSANSAFSTAKTISPGSSTFQTSAVTDQPIMTAQSSSSQLPGLMIDAFTSTSTALLPENISVKGASSNPQITSSGSSKSQDSKLIAQPITTLPPSFHQTMELSEPLSCDPISEIYLVLSPPSFQPEESSKPRTSISTTQSITTVPSNPQISELASHLLLFASSPSFQSSEELTSATTTQPITNAPPQSIQLPEPSQYQNGPPIKPISQIVCTAATSTASPSVVPSSFGGEILTEGDPDLEEIVILSVTKKPNFPCPSKSPRRRMKEEIEKKDALLERMYSVPAFGGKAVKGAGFFEKMLTKSKLCHLFKCMASDCSYTCNQKTLFDSHIKMHEAQLDTQKKRPKNHKEDDDEVYDWQQCAYCCESPTYPKKSLSEHLITEHGYCVYQCAYCFYRALFQNYVDIHQTLAHRKILKNKPRLVYKCKAFSKGPTVTKALKKTGRRRCVRPYVCCQCESQFLITEEFMNHLLKKHQSVTSYTCHICKTVCFKPDRLVVHYKLHAYSTYQCAYCLHGTETERKMFFHLCTFHFAQPACLYMRAWYGEKPTESEDKSKKVKKRTKCTDQLANLKMISYDIEAIAGGCTLEEASDDESGDEDRLVIDESQELNDIIAELGIGTETDPSEGTSFMHELATIGNSAAQNDLMSALLPNAKFSLEGETEVETVLISSGSSSNASSILTK